MDENPYESPRSSHAAGLSASMEGGESILVQIAARSFSGRDRLFRFRPPVIGMFVVTNRRVFFLSSGRSGGFAIVSEAAMIERIAKSLDMRALQRTGSWDFTATELQSVEAARRPFLRGTCLRVIGCDKYGNNVCHQVYRPAVWRKTWEFVAAEINEVRQNVSLEVVGIEAKSS